MFVVLLLLGVELIKWSGEEGGLREVRLRVRSARSVLSCAASRLQVSVCTIQTRDNKFESKRTLRAFALVPQPMSAAIDAPLGFC